MIVTPSIALHLFFSNKIIKKIHQTNPSIVTLFSSFPSFPRVQRSEEVGEGARLARLERRS